MVVRFGVLGETAAEVADGLAILAMLQRMGVDLRVTQRAAEMTPGRWMATVAPKPAAPAGEGQGREG